MCNSSTGWDLIQEITIIREQSGRNKISQTALPTSLRASSGTQLKMAWCMWCHGGEGLCKMERAQLDNPLCKGVCKQYTTNGHQSQWMLHLKSIVWWSVMWCKSAWKPSMNIHNLMEIPKCLHQYHYVCDCFHIITVHPLHHVPIWNIMAYIHTVHPDVPLNDVNWFPSKPQSMWLFPHHYSLCVVSCAHLEHDGTFSAPLPHCQAGHANPMRSLEAPTHCLSWTHPIALA